MLHIKIGTVTIILGSKSSGFIFSELWNRNCSLLSEAVPWMDSSVTEERPPTMDATGLAKKP